MFKVLSLILLSILLSACSVHRNVGVVYHDSFDFSQVKNYSLYPRNSSFTDSQSLTDVRRNAIEIAIEGVMAAQKFTYIEPEQADIIVTYFFFNRKSAEYSKYNKAVRFCVHCLRANAWQTNKYYAKFIKGSLIIDLVDPHKKRSVWRSAYPLKFNSKDNSAELNDKIQQAVRLMLAKYPEKNAISN